MPYDEMTEYLIPNTVEEAIYLLNTHAGQALIIAGGTDVLPDIRKGKSAPGCLVDVTRIPELTAIRVDDGYVTVGAAVTFAMLREHPYLQQHVHALVEAAASVGAAPIQSAATWGGNLVQAMPAADGAIIAIALDTELRVLDRAGAGWIPVLDSFAGPGRSYIDPTRQFITTIRFPIPMTPWGTAWRRAGRRPSLILPTLNSAVKLVLDDDGSRITAAAIGIGPVASCPHRASEAEAYLIGRAPEPEIFAEAARLAEHGADPRSSIYRASREYRLAILPVLVEEALGVAVERARREYVMT
jgi:carbon-monoxide dehydrogenase medium subunit